MVIRSAICLGKLAPTVGLQCNTNKVKYAEKHAPKLISEKYSYEILPEALAINKSSNRFPIYILYHKYYVHEVNSFLCLKVLQLNVKLH